MFKMSECLVIPPAGPRQEPFSVLIVKRVVPVGLNLCLLQFNNFLVEIE